MKYFILLLSMYLMMPCDAVGAEISAYVDENGKVQITNMAPPPSKMVVVIGEEVNEPPEVAEKRLQQKKAEIEKESLERQENIQRENDLARERQLEQDRKNREIKEKKKTNQAKIDAEERILEQKQENWFLKCEIFHHQKHRYGIYLHCLDIVKERFSKTHFLLDSSPDYYFENRDRIDQENERELESLYKF